MPDDTTGIYLGSDNQAGVHPKVIEAIAAANQGYASGYGDDGLTACVEERFKELFETDCSVFLVTTGTAANALALSAMCPPWGGVYTHDGSHIINDENTAPEFFSGGARLIGIEGEAGKPSLAGIRNHVESCELHGTHSLKPAAISLSNVTEAGTVLDFQELALYGQLAREHRLGFHVDGARFANAVVSTGLSAAEMTWKAGVDALSFGATKNGAIAAEAVVIFDQTLAEDFGYRRKRAGQLWSKHRFLSAQFDALLTDNLWLEIAGHANRMASKLATGLAAIPGVELPWPTQANEVFPVLPEKVNTALQTAGCEFYPWPVYEGMVRMVASFTTAEGDIDRLLALASAASD